MRRDTRREPWPSYAGRSGATGLAGLGIVSIGRHFVKAQIRKPPILEPGVLGRETAITLREQLVSKVSREPCNNQRRPGALSPNGTGPTSRPRLHRGRGGRVRDPAADPLTRERTVTGAWWTRGFRDTRARESLLPQQPGVGSAPEVPRVARKKCFRLSRAYSPSLRGGALFPRPASGLGEGVGSHEPIGSGLSCFWMSSPPSRGVQILLTSLMAADSVIIRSGRSLVLRGADWSGAWEPRTAGFWLLLSLNPIWALSRICWNS